MAPTHHTLSLKKSRSILLLLILGALLALSGCMGKSLPPNFFFVATF